MQVRELLRRKRGADVITIHADADVGTAARLLLQHSIGGVPVVARDGAVVGLIAERDIVQALIGAGENAARVSVSQAMRRPAPSCRSDDSLRELMERMTRERWRHVVVLDGQHIAGVVSVGDLVKHRLEELETETGVLRDYVAARRAIP